MSSNRRGYQQIGKREHHQVLRKRNRQQLITLLCRQHKRDLIARGIIQDPQLRPPRYKFMWVYGSMSGAVFADDRSYARSLIKRELGISRKHRLPIEVEITRELNVEVLDEDSRECPEESVGSTDHGGEAGGTVQDDGDASECSGSRMQQLHS